METGIIQKLNENVSVALSAQELAGFEKAYTLAKAAGELKLLLNAEYMKPIMELQGNRIGFKTDRDDKNGYPVETVKNCIIEAVLMGVQPVGNQFNIIAGNCYLTKEGIGYLLKNIPGLSYDIVFTLPRINQEKTSAAITAKITWSINGSKNVKEIDIPVKMNSFMGTDAVIGKATRKARKWLYDTITSSELPEGDVQDADVVSTTIHVNPKKETKDPEAERIELMIQDATTKEELEAIKPHLKPDQQDLFNQKLQEVA